MKEFLKPVGILLFISVLFFGAFSGCKKEEPIELPPKEENVVNEFIYDITSTYYLWEQYIPSGIDINDYPDSYELFDTLKYKTLDHWSALTDNYQDFQNSLDGIRKVAGYRLQLFEIAGSQNLYGIVGWVYAGSSAEQAGLKRGDIIVKINGQNLSADNLNDLLSLDSYTIALGQIVGDQVSETGETLSAVKTELAINPILYYDVIDVQGTKIGYFVYDQFLDSYTAELENVFSYFASESIDELVLDLRYNPGGYVTTCANLASMIAPANALDKTFLTMQWNDLLTDYLTQEFGSESDYFITNFPKPNINIDMGRMVVLTSTGSASASEAIINGLSPYMDITIIGERTAGKYTGASLFYDMEEQKHDWGIYLVINRIANSLGNTDYVDGFTPDFEVADDYTTPLGDIAEPLLAKAIEQLTGVIAKKAKSRPENIIPFANYYESELEQNGIMYIDKKLRGFKKD
ncbi:MAG: S41 family peptidase [Bacteroidota bacterium]